MPRLRATIAHRAVNRRSIGPEAAEPIIRNSADALVVASGPPHYTLTAQAAHHLLGNALFVAGGYLRMGEYLLKISDANMADEAEATSTRP